MRQKWDLNGKWSFQIDPKSRGEIEGWKENGVPLGQPVQVPHIWQRESTELLGYNGVAWYSRSFTMQEIDPHACYKLYFGAVDYQARVWLNGAYMGEHEGGFTPFEWDVTQVLATENTLVVRVYDPYDNAEIPIGKQGSWYTRVSGIWQEVYLEKRVKTYIESVQVVSDREAGSIQVAAKVGGARRDSLAIHYEIRHHQGEQLLHSGVCELDGNTAKFEVNIANPILWSPENPHLYDLDLHLAGDFYSTPFGLRKIEYRDGLLYLNNKPLYIRGALDQAFYPDTVYVAPSDEFIQKEIRLAKEMGFNLLRKHIKVEIPRYLYWADRMGMLIWAEPPNYVKWTKQGQTRFQNELTAMIQRDFNHPSIIIWSIYNEEWGLEWDLARDPEKQKHVAKLYDDVKVLDPTRLICDNSGWAHVKTDINDYHRYYASPDQVSAWQKDLDEFILGDPNQNFVAEYQSNGREPIIVSEFGVWGLPSVQAIEEHYGGKPWWFINQGEQSHQEDYKKPTTAAANFDRFQVAKSFDDFEELAVASQRRMFRAIKSVIEEMRKRPAIAGWVVTEFTDIEWETNGWLDYLRQPKAGFERLKDFNGALSVMVDTEEHNFWSGDTRSFHLVLSNHEGKQIKGKIQWELRNTDIRDEIPVEVNGDLHLVLPNAITISFPAVEAAGFYDLHVALVAGDEILAQNTEEFTISPKVLVPQVSVTPYNLDSDFIERLKENGFAVEEQLQSDRLVVTSTLDEQILQYVQDGGKVIFLAEEGDLLESKGQFTFRHLPEGESWPRASSFNFVNRKEFEGIPLRPEMGWEVDELIPNYVVPFCDYNKPGRRRNIHLFGNPGLAESCDILSGYFQGWIGQVGGSMLRKNEGAGSILLTTWRLKQNYGVHPIATQVVNKLVEDESKSLKKVVGTSQS